MIFKYYTHETVRDGIYVGSRVYRVMFYKTPIDVMKLAMSSVSEGLAIVNLRRIK